MSDNTPMRPGYYWAKWRIEGGFVVAEIYATDVFTTISIGWGDVNVTKDMVTDRLQLVCINRKRFKPSLGSLIGKWFATEKEACDAAIRHK